MKKNYRKDTTCLNCAQEVDGKFCSNCGQENVETKEHVGHMLTHAIGDYFHFDSKFTKTMKPLFFQPGLLTNEYNAGKRSTYLPAIRMYIFISIVFFLFISVNSGTSLSIGEKGGEPKRELTMRESALAASRAAKTPAEIDSIKSLSPAQKKAAKVRLAKPVLDDLNNLTAEEYIAKQKALPEANRDGYLSYYFQHKALELKEREDIQQTFTETLVHNLPKMMFLLLPLFALILMLLFRKSRMFYAEHFIYALHLHSFLYLFLLIPILLGKVMPVPDLISWIIFFVIAFYIYRSLRTVYNNSRKKTIVKMALMGASYGVLLGLCLFMLVVGTFLML